MSHLAREEADAESAAAAWRRHTEQMTSIMTRQAAIRAETIENLRQQLEHSLTMGREQEEREQQFKLEEVHCADQLRASQMFGPLACETLRSELVAKTVEIQELQSVCHDKD